MRNTWLNGASWRSMMAFDAEAGDGGGAAPVAPTVPAPPEDPAAPAVPESVLFPKDGDKPTEGDGKAKEEPEGWKPYTDDPAKSKEENDAARAAHELTNPDNPINKVPDDGKYEFKMPEGMELDAKMAEVMSPVLKDIGLTRGQAQKLAENLAAYTKQKAEAGAKEWADINTGWIASAKKDQEIGGAKWDGSVKVAQSALARFGTPALNAFLAESGGGNHPEVIRFMTRVGSAIAEDKPETGDSAGKGQTEAAYTLFPNDKPKG